MYVRPNYASKRLLEDAVKAGDDVEVFSPWELPFPPDGIFPIVGPHNPEPCEWTARVVVKAGRVVKVIS